MNLANPPQPDFLKLMTHLYRAGAFGYYWACSEARDENGYAKQKSTTWFPVAKPGYLPSDKAPHGAMHLYFGIHPTTMIPPTSSKGEPRKPHQVRSQLQYIAGLNCLFGEYDAKDFDGGKETIMAHIDGLVCQPSIIIDSVGGYHVYWLLKDTFAIKTDADRARADAIQKAWVPFVGSDEEAKDLTRVLRIPGTRNYKATYAPAFPTVTVILADFDMLYTLDELEAMLPEPVQIKQPQKSNRKPRARPFRDELLDASKALDMLAPWRCEDYRADDGAWIGVGMALSGLKHAGLGLWEDWSRGSSKYVEGECERKWKTFNPNGAIGLGSLFHWAKADSPVQYEETIVPKKEERKPAPSAPIMPPPPPEPPAYMVEHNTGKPAASSAARQLPHNVKAEVALLGELLNNEDAFLDVQGIVEPGDFYQKKHGWIFEALLALHSRGHGFDVVTVSDELAALEYHVSDDELFELIDSHVPIKNALHHAQIVRRFGIARRLIGAAKRIERLGYESVSSNMESALVEAEALLLDVTQERETGQGPRALAELLPASEARLQEMSQTQAPIGVPAVPASFSRLIGGWQPGKVYIVAGYPGDGKTSMMLANAKHAADTGADTLAFTQEMTSDELIQKMIGSEGHIDSQILQSGPIDGATFRQAQQAVRRMAEKTHLWIDDTSGLTWLDMKTRALRVDMALQRRGRKLKLIVVDYVQYMRHIYRKGSNDAAAITDTMKGLKSIAKDLKVPVIVASQLNRDGAKEGQKPRKPRLSDCRDSSGIESEGDAVIFIYYDDPEGCPDNPDLILAKNRGGRKGKRTVHFNKAHNVWQDVGHQEEPQGYHNGNGHHHDEYAGF
jgi:replicative DNA helicase